LDPRKENQLETIPPWKLVRIEQARSDPRLIRKKNKEVQTKPETVNVEVQTDPVVLFPLPPPDISPPSSSDSAPEFASRHIKATTNTRNAKEAKESKKEA